MTLHSPHLTPAATPLRERLLCYGSEKSGKTSAWLSIARLLHDTGSTATVYVIDGDATTDKFLYDPASPYHLLPNVQVEKAFRWPSYVSAMRKFTEAATVNDWIVLDMATGAWQAVQSYYYEQAYGKTIDEVLLERKKSGEKDEGVRDFQTINPIYFSFILPWSVETPAHVYAAAAEKSLGFRESKGVTALFKAPGEDSISTKPDAQNRLGYQVDTIIRVQMAVPGKSYVMSTLGDRGGREFMTGKPLSNFAYDYLVEVAGWLLA